VQSLAYSPLGAVESSSSEC